MLAFALALATSAFIVVAIATWRTLHNVAAATSAVRDCGRAQQGALATVRVEAQRARRLRAPGHTDD